MCGQPELRTRGSGLRVETAMCAVVAFDGFVKVVRATFGERFAGLLTGHGCPAEIAIEKARKHSGADDGLHRGASPPRVPGGDVLRPNRPLVPRPRVEKSRPLAWPASAASCEPSRTAAC